MIRDVTTVLSRSSILARILPLGCAALLVALPQPVFAQDGSGTQAPYLDDRSTPDALIESYYSAINRQEYVRAYSYYSEAGREPDFAKYAKGYQDTKSVEIKLGKPEGDAAAGSRYWSLPIAIKSTSNDGTAKVFTGCYTLRLVSPAAQITPPYQPMSIMTGSLTPSEKSLEESVPERCETP